LSAVSKSKAQFQVPPERRIALILIRALRQYLKLYPVPRPAEVFCLESFHRAIAALTPLESSAGRPARLSLTTAGKRLRVTLRFPTQRSRASRLRAQLPHTPPGVRFSLTQNGSSALLSLTAPLVKRH
jgi:hypothetical protein